MLQVSLSVSLKFHFLHVQQDYTILTTCNLHYYNLLLLTLLLIQAKIPFSATCANATCMGPAIPSRWTRLLATSSLCMFASAANQEFHLLPSEVTTPREDQLTLGHRQGITRTEN